MLFKQISTKWAEQICQTAGETDEYKIALIRYVFESILSFCLSFTVLLLIALLLGLVKEALLIGLTGAFIKSFTGGLHMSTPLRCAVWGAISLVVVCYLSILIPVTAIPMVLIVIILGAANVIVWLKAPREAPGKPLSDKQKHVLAILSRIIIFIISIICLLWSRAWGINELFYGTVFHVINLLDITALGTAKLDDILGKIEKRAIF